MESNTIATVLVLGLILFGFVMVALGYRRLVTRQEERRVQTFVAQRTESPGSRNLDQLVKREFSETLFQRTIESWIAAAISFLSRFTPPQTIQETNRRLIIAGSPLKFRAPQFYGVRILLLMIGVVTSFIIYQFKPSITYLIWALLVLLVFIAAPSVWLTVVMRRRQENIRQGLPDALDMLSVITAAGLSFDLAMLYLGQTFKTQIGLEFARVVSEMEVGISRKQALRSLQERVDIMELSSFVSIILQSEALGMSIADVLHSQAEQMRILRQYRAKEIAQKLPAKMMVPLAFFIFPALLAVLLGPFIPLLLGVLK